MDRKCMCIEIGTNTHAYTNTWIRRQQNKKENNVGLYLHEKLKTFMKSFSFHFFFVKNFWDVHITFLLLAWKTYQRNLIKNHVIHLPMFAGVWCQGNFLHLITLSPSNSFFLLQTVMSSRRLGVNELNLLMQDQF